MAVLFGNAGRNLSSEKIVDRLKTGLISQPGNTTGRLNADHLHALPLKRCQHRAIVTAQIDNQRRGRHPPIVNYFLRILIVMVSEPDCQAAHVNVIGITCLRTDDMRQMQITAILA